MNKNNNNLYFKAILLYVLVVPTIGMYMEYGFKMATLYLITTSILAALIYIPMTRQNKNTNTEELN